MKILIIEDEIRAAQQLQSMLKENDPSVEILGTLDSVEDSIAWLKSNHLPDLLFMDIQLADGLSFEIFNSISIEAPIIFTTAYDQYSIKAFKVNSVDYLLKPLVEEDLRNALNKYRKLYETKTAQPIDALVLEKLVNNLSQEKGRKRFIVKEGNSMTFVQVEDVQYFYSEDGISFLMTKQNKRYIVDMTLEAIEKDLLAGAFFRINRHQIVSIDSINKMQPYFNNRLMLDIEGGKKMEFLVARKRVSDFRAWVNQ